MIKVILFDIYGMIIDRDMRFSKRFSAEFNVSLDKILAFFHNEFQLCLVGKADLKTELQKYLKDWGWRKSTDELVEYWFGHEGNINTEMLESVKTLKKSDIKCFLNTQNDKYLVKYVFESLELKKHFDGIFSTSQIGFKKPEREYWQAIYDQLGKPNKESVLCWDDEKTHVEAARKFGFSAELYENFEEYKNKIKSYIK